MAIRLLILLCLLGGAAILHAQATPTATRRLDLHAGAGLVSAHADAGYDTAPFPGAFLFIDADFTQHLGIELEAHQVVSSTGDQVHERTYEAGVRYRRTYGRAVPYAKLLAGRGVFNFPQNVANLAYNMAAAGAGLDFALTPRVNLRGDFEAQAWTGFQGTTLHPSLLSIGAAYRF